MQRSLGLNSENKGSVSETCFELLHMEMVDYIKRQFGLDGSETAADRKAQMGKVQNKLDSIGFQVGLRLAERYTRDQGWFVEHLDIVKYVCTEFWLLVFKKKCDKLQTNYKDTYVVHDLAFRWLLRISAPDMAVEDAEPYTAFACGIIRGALSNLGVNVSVKADIKKFPACEFTLIDLDKKKARGTGTTDS